MSDAPDPDLSVELPTLAQILAAADTDRAILIRNAFTHAAQGADMRTVWWAFAMLQAHLLARAPPGLELWLATQLMEMCKLALPGELAARASADAEPPPVAH